ncbi:MAG: ROK family protein [Geobacter sp.]|nr:ROK family protein [Geobacter sp.]
MSVRSGQAYIGIDIGGTNLRLALVAPDGDILHRERRKTSVVDGGDAFLELLEEGIGAVRESAAAMGVKVAAIGAGMPGLIDRQGTIRSSVNLRPLEGVNLRERLEEASGLPVTVVNDANAIAYGEKIYGAGRDFGSFLLLTLGTGVGSGLVLDGRLWSGSDGFASEFGHATVEPEGIKCPCGNRGCLEQYASATALVRSARASLNPEGDDEMAAEKVAALAKAGDKSASSLFEQVGRYLGIASATAINLLNLDAVIVGGGMAAAFELFYGALREEVDSRAFAEMAGRVRIVRAALGDDAGLFGSAALAKELLDDNQEAI